LFDIRSSRSAATLPTSVQNLGQPRVGPMVPLRRGIGFFFGPFRGCDGVNPGCVIAELDQEVDLTF